MLNTIVIFHSTLQTLFIHKRTRAILYFFLNKWWRQILNNYTFSIKNLIQLYLIINTMLFNSFHRCLQLRTNCPPMADGVGLRMDIQALRQTLKTILLSNEQIDVKINIIKEEIISLRTEWNGLASSFFSCTFFFYNCIPLKSILPLKYEYFVNLYLIFTIVFFQSSTERKSFFIQTKHICITSKQLQRLHGKTVKKTLQSFDQIVFIYTI